MDPHVPPCLEGKTKDWPTVVKTFVAVSPRAATPPVLPRAIAGGRHLFALLQLATAISCEDPFEEDIPAIADRPASWFSQLKTTFRK
ncbi:hypothetical protein MPL3356_110415 [Mesorhizobium plurifarium]|uniref:Uncharacterized protein n=1 Tax=Mesorhizobium plurifarium TaxID=69974 RepID=A0A090EYU5_MESPL|nr:hypothetical protein MPL3356_110415 [Mesorhizobium plurifarium]